jgi:hypothetical protein
MSRRASLPGADELFRSTSPLLPPAPDPASAPERPERLEATPDASAAAVAPVPPAGADRPGAVAGGPRRASGRQRHEEKITVYCSAEELMDLERARLALRGDHGVAVDRGRIVRAAVALALAELEERGSRSRLVEHLRTH